MNISINTKFNIGDKVYIADLYYDFYACRKPHTIIDILIDINRHRTHIMYEVKQDNVTYRVPERLTFDTYEECAKWCEEHNRKGE